MENTKADALSKRKDYSGKLIERPRAIFKEEGDGLKYNYKLFAIIAVVEDNILIKELRQSYSGDEYRNRVLNYRALDFIIDK